MESDNWIVQNLQSALNTWNDKLNEIWTLLTQDPESFKGGAIWSVMTNINGALKAIALGLLVLFFAMGIIKTCGSFTEMKKPEHVLKAFIRFALAQGAVVYGMDLMKALFSIIQGIVTTILANASMSGGTVSQLPAEIVEKVESVGMLDSIPLWIVTLLGSLLITVLSFIMILTVYVQAVYVYRHCTHSPFVFCRGAVPIGREKLHPFLCGSLSGGSDHCIGLYHIFSIHIQHTCRVGYQPVGGDDCLELCGRAGV